MKRILQKILPSFLLTAILVIAGGFFDGMSAQAKTLSMAENMVPGQMMHIMSNGPVLHQAMPMDNTLKPCCENKQGGASAIQTATPNQNIKIVSIGFADHILNNNFVFEHKITELSSASPPRPDVLSSVLKKE